VDTKSEKTLPKMLSGAVCVQWKKCGKPGCRCTRDELHGPYYARFWRQDGRLRKAYVRRPDLGQVLASCESNKLQRLAIKIGWQDYRQLLQALRERINHNEPA
jgi:hypothetical protein